MIMIYSISIVIILELALVAIVKYFRREFQWFVTEKDEYQVLIKQGLAKFFKHGFDGHVGWVSKPNTECREKTRFGQAKFTIDPKGARSNPLVDQKGEVIATFGDSYTFCRQVNNDQTWQVYLTNMMGVYVSNYGVGNYGVDQALLRYERTELPPSIKIVILGFIPETICRIQSYWKHYLEFGNTFAFKPRFVLDNERLKLLPNVMQSPEDFSSLKEKLPHIQQNDVFYKTKFRQLQFRFPYTVSFLKNSKRNTQLIKSLLIRQIRRKLGRTSPEIENAPFGLIMKFNISQAHKMYLSNQATSLFRAILMRFKDAAEKRGHKPIIMVMPQLIDLVMNDSGNSSYRKFFKNLNCGLDIIDLSEFVLKHDIRELYTEDLYGGHFSKRGNELIAEYLSHELKKYPILQQQIS